MASSAPKFRDYKDYVVSEPGKPSSAYNAATTTPTGFLEFKPRDMETQTKYDAMSPSWQGVASSTAAVARGDYSLDSAETTRRELREQVKVPYVGKPQSIQVEATPARVWDSALKEFVKLKPAQPAPEDVKLAPPIDTKSCIIQ
jgi:hypothetical protein